MLPSDPDEAVLQLFELRASLGEAAGIDGFAQVGDVLAAKCGQPGCNSITHRWGSSKRCEICTDCKEPWPSEALWVPKEIVQTSPRAANFDSKYSDLVALAQIVGRLHRTHERDAILYVLFLHPEHGGAVGAANRANTSRLTEHTETEHTVDRAVGRARRTLRELLRLAKEEVSRAGLWGEGVSW